MAKAKRSLTDMQIDILVSMFKIVDEKKNVLRGSLPGSPGQMTKVGEPLASTLRAILGWHELGVKEGIDTV
jgi:hypothetical protein